MRFAVVAVLALLSFTIATNAQNGVIMVDGDVSLGSSMGIISDGEHEYVYGRATRNLDILLKGCPIRMGETMKCKVRLVANGRDVAEIVEATSGTASRQSPTTRPDPDPAPRAAQEAQLPGPASAGWFVLMARANIREMGIGSSQGLEMKANDVCVAVISNAESKNRPALAFETMFGRNTAPVTKRFGPFRSGEEAESALQQAGWQFNMRYSMWVASSGC